MKKLFLIMTVSALIGACAGDDMPKVELPEIDTNNPLLAEWDTPHATPPFDKIEIAHYEPAFETAIAVSRAEVEAIIAEFDKDMEEKFKSDPYHWYELYFKECDDNVAEIKAVVENKNIKVSEAFSDVPSDEPMIPLMEGLAFDTGNMVVVNILNDGGYMKGLPTDYEVEIVAKVGKNGVKPVHNDGLPKPVMAHLFRDRIAPVEVELAAFENHSREMLVDLVMMDPWTKSRAQAEKLIDDIFALPCNSDMKEYYK